MRLIEDLRLAFIELVGDVGLMGTYGTDGTYRDLWDLWRLVVTGWELGGGST